MFKFLHAADVHLDSPLHKLDLYEGAPVEEFRRATRRAFENLIQLAISEKVDFLLIAGDLYDGDWKDYNTGLYLVSHMSRLRDCGIPAFIVAGNHDAASSITKSLRLPDNVTLFPPDRPATVKVEKLNLAIHGQSFSTPAVRKDLSLGYPPAGKGLYNIGLLHTCATGREGHEPYAPCSLDGLVNKGYDYWALGHVHQHEILCKNPPVVFAGNTQGRNIRELGPKGCVLVTIDDSGWPKLECKPLDVVRWAIAELDATDTKSGFDIVDRFSRRLEALTAENEGLPMAVRVHIHGETDAADTLLSDIERWKNEIRSASLDFGKGRVWVEKTKINISLPGAGRLSEPCEGAVGELLKLFGELDADPDARMELADELSDLEKKLPPELRGDIDGVRFADAQWLGELLTQVRPMLLKRLLRKRAPE